MLPKEVVPLETELCLRMLGAWPKTPFPIFQRIFMSIITLVSIVCQVSYSLTYYQTADLPDLLDTITVCLSYVYISTKVVILWCNYRKLGEVLQTIAEDQHDKSMTDEDKRYLMVTSQFNNRIAKFFLMVNSMLWLLYSLTALTTPDVVQPDPKNRRYILRMRLPFETWNTPVYEILTVVQLSTSYTVAYSAGMVMAVNPILVLHAGCLFDILCRDIRRLSSCDAKEAPLILKSVIAKHQKTIRYSENIQNVFVYQLLVQFLTNILTNCFLAFILISSVGNGNAFTLFTKLIPFYITANSEAFIICYVGELLISKSQCVHETAYNVQWYNFNLSDCRAIMFIMLRAQKQLALTAGKFVILNMETFTNMVKASASYTSILLAMY